MHAIQVDMRFSVLAVAQENRYLLSEVTKALQRFAFGQPPDIVVQKEVVVVCVHFCQQLAKQAMLEA